MTSKANDDTAIALLDTQTGEQDQHIVIKPDLIRRAASDPESFAVLYRSCATQVYRYIYSRVSDHPEAEDLTAQVFMVVLQRLDSFGGNQNFNAWLFTIARNKVVDAYRKRKNLIDLEKIVDLPQFEEDLLADESQLEQFRQLRIQLNKLSLEQQELLRLRFAANLRYGEIGNVLGKSEGAVKMSLHRLLDQLREAMEASDER